ncbi:hypothetical protein BOX15_Mlig000217g1 [Macrostomum lignano]|uniref:RGS domain-containing protein n=1 Tax=Macrostomum lignano TaxID=282301 RepID=A0A267E302_9PLAT|nr:hypothetical protein BOX15_Mlig016004g1 [Macrostomum lignano]PAA73068.1 hypothetical protein BOX15_Mlig000217g1 [Macrostomum lignano]
MAFGSGVVDAPDAIDDTAATGGPSDWSAGLDRLLADPTGVKLFAEFLRGEFSEENVAFWLAVERYRAIEDQEALSTEAARIVYDFIGINAPQCVNLDGATVEQLRADILDASRPPPSRHAFDKAQRHIYDLMRMDSYARFLKSSCYREAVAAAAAQRQQRPLTIGAETLDNGGGAKRRGFLASLVRGRTLRRHSDQQQQHGSRSPSPPSASALPTAAGCCRVQLADGSSALLDVRGAAGQQQRSLREALLDLCERRGLNFAAAEVRVLNDDEPDGVSGSGGLDAPLSAFAGRQIRMERRVLFRLELPAPAGRCVGVRARPAKSLRDVLRPVCGRYGLRLDRLVVCRESGFVPLGLDAPVDCVDGLRLCALPKEDFVDFHLFGDNRVPPRRRQNHQQKSAASAVKRSSIGHAVHRLLKSSFA